MLLEVIVNVLEEAGFVVFSATRGEDVQALLEKGIRPCLILCDLLMPGLGVAELFARLAADPRTRDVPLAIMTGSRDELLPQVAYVLLKPFSLTALTDVVSHACTMYRSEQSGSECENQSRMDLSRDKR